ncbi:MAG: T9SS type A sorting domain-containing protein, partial [Flavobacteriaceae bacterium]|nr:T9SS type A sorting domain-containing protein [Flavobacteriaceae bacterium]
NPNTVWYVGVDADSDGFFGSTTSVTQCLSPGAGYALAAQTTDDCDDTNATINPNTVWYVGVDADSDGFFGSTTSVTQCLSPGAGYALAAQTTDDCDDSNATINPDATEVTDDGIDQDCDGVDLVTLEIDNFNMDNVLLMPNPFKDNIVIKLPLTLNNSEINIKVFDLNGRLVFNKLYHSSNNTINISGLDKLEQAPYLFEIINKETNVSIIKRLIKY